MNLPPGAMPLDEFLRNEVSVREAFERLPLSEEHTATISDLLAGRPREYVVRASLTAGWLLHEAALVEELAAAGKAMEELLPTSGPVHRGPRRRRTRGR